MKRIPNVETAKSYLKELGKQFRIEQNKRNDHYKLYIENCKEYILLSAKKDNRDRVKRDINKMIGV